MSWKVVLALALVARPAPLIAQNGNGGGTTRLAGRVPAAALPAIDSILAAAAAESLPTEPLVQKALEGGAKNIPADRLVNGVRRGLLQLRQARAIVSHAVPGQLPPEGHVAAGGAALAPRPSGPLVERLITPAPGEPPRPALHAAAGLVAHHLPPGSAAHLLVGGATK